MDCLLKRKYFKPDLKLTSKKLWRRLLALSRSPPHLDHPSQERILLPETPLNTCNTAAHHRTHKLFTFLYGHKSLSSNTMGFSGNQRDISFLQRATNLKLVHFSSASFLETSDGHNTSHNLKYGINDTGLNVQVDSFVRELHSCTSAEDILTLAERAILMRYLREDCLSVLFSAYQKKVYEALTFPWLFPELHLKKMQLEYNFITGCILEPYTTDCRFQNLISYAETLVEEIPYSDCLKILHSLFYLFMNTANSNFARTICDKCSENLDRFNLNQLAVFSSCLQSFPNDLVLLGKISDATKKWLMTHSFYDMDLGDLCTVFQNTRHVVSADMFELGAGAIISKLKSDPSNVTLDMISKIYLFVYISNHECKESLVNGVQDLPSECFNVDITNNDLTFDVCSNIGGNPWLCPILQRLRAHCISELNKADQMSVHDMVKYSLLLKSQSKSIMNNKRKLFVQFVKESDNFLLQQLMRHHCSPNMIYLPDNNELMHAYHQRLVKLFTSLSETQQAELLWRNDGQFGELLFKLLFQFHCDLIPQLRASGMQLNQDLIRALDNSHLLKPNEWDTPSMKLTVIILYALEKLKSNTVMTPSELSTMKKFFYRLDLINLMKICKNLGMIHTQVQLSPAAKKQCRELKARLLEIFESKLSRTNTLTPSLSSNEILPLPKKGRHWVAAGGEAYDQLIDNLPRFLKSGDDKNHLRALGILYFSAETYPLYQKETFETLINFVTSSPKLLVYPGIQLVKVLAYAGYQPDTAGNFAEWTQQLTAKVMEHRLLDKYKLVHLAYHLSLLGIFNDALLLKIFSLDFLTALEQELDETTLNKSDRIKHDLALLGRSVAIECPHHAVPWFGRSLLIKNSKQPSDAVDTVIESACRLTGDVGYVVKSAKSPYAHDIDALMYFDPSSGLVKHEDVQSTNPFPDIEKIALLCVQQHHFCHGSDVLLGKYQADIRQLEMLGYTVILFTEKELSSMEVHNEESLDNHIRTKINASSHFQVFRDSQQ